MNLESKQTDIMHRVVEQVEWLVRKLQEKNTHHPLLEYWRKINEEETYAAFLKEFGTGLKEPAHLWLRYGDALFDAFGSASCAEVKRERFKMRWVSPGYA